MGREATAVVVESAQRGEAKASGLGDAAFAVVGEVVAVFQHAGELRGEGALQAGEHAAAVVEVGGGDVKVTGLGDDAAALIVDIAGGGDGQVGAALQRAAAVAEAGGLQLDVAVLAVNQTVAAVLHGAGSGQLQLPDCGQGAAVAVVQAARQQCHQALAGQLATLVVDLCGAVDAQRPSTGELAVTVGEHAEQVEGGGTVAGDAASAVVQGAAAEAEGLLGGDGARSVAKGHGVKHQGGAAVDQAVLAVVEGAGDGQGLACSAGENTGAVVEAVGVHGKGTLGNQRALVTVKQCATEADSQVATAAGQSAEVAVIELPPADLQALAARNQAALVG